MNQQFISQQPYGAPVPPPSVQNYQPTSRPSPGPVGPGVPPSATTSGGGFQTVPLGPSAATSSIDPHAPPPNAYHPQLNKFMPPTNRPPPASQLPPGQVPNPRIAGAPAHFQNGAALTDTELNQQDPLKPPPPVKMINNLSGDSAVQNNMMPPPPMGSGQRGGQMFPPQQQQQQHQRMPGQQQQSMFGQANPAPQQQQQSLPPTSNSMPPPMTTTSQSLPPTSGPIAQPPPPVSMPGPPALFENGPTTTTITTAQSMFGGPPPPRQEQPAAQSEGPPMFTGRPPVMGQQPQPQQQPMPGQLQQQPPMSEQLPQQQQPPMPGQLQQQPPMHGPPQTGQLQQQPPMHGPPQTGQSMPGGPPMSAQMAPLPAQQPQIPGQQSHMPEHHPQMPGQQPQMPGQQPHMPGQQPQMPGQHPQMPGQQPHLHGQQPQMPGPPPMGGQMPPMPGQHSMGGQQQQSLPPPPQHLQQQQMPPHPGQPPMMAAMPPGGPPPQPGHMHQHQQQPGGGMMGGVPPPSSGVGGPGPPRSGGGGMQPPPVSGQQQMRQVPPMGQPGLVKQQPPMAGQAMTGYNQQPDGLSGPMQNMNLGGPRMYPQQPMNGTTMTAAGPTLSGMPHMPPLQPRHPQHPQQQPQPQPQHMPPRPGGGYMNGAQSPQMMGAPPLPPQGGGYPGMGGMPPPLAQRPGLGGPMAPGGPMPPGGGGGYPGGAPGGYPQQQQAQKQLDPDQMPSQIQVTEDDQSMRSGVFATNQKGLVPPLVTTDFTVQDQGHASPRYVRSTMYSVPVSNDLMKQTAVPFGLTISPMARTLRGEYQPPCVDFGTLGPVRCVRCKAYMCPYMQFIDAGRRFQCPFCRASTEVPTEYFQHLDHTGQRMDRLERPELVLGAYELIATADYCRSNTYPKPPAFIFVLDVSYNSVKSGLVHLMCAEMRQILRNLPLDQGQEQSAMRVGFITFDRDVHFYNIKGNLAAPQMLVVGDTHEMFMPLLDGFLCTPEESEAVIDSLMEQIPKMFGETKECETILLPAITAGLEALKASECAGKLLVFHSTLPTADAPGKLKNRDERKLLGTDKERTVLAPQSTVYNQLGQDCVAAGCSVDLYVFNNAYIDLATIGQVARLTGGEVFKYTYFQADLDGTRLLNDVITNISRPIAFDSIMRVRTSTGVRPTDFYGHFYMSNTTDIELAAVDCDKAIAVEVKHDDKLSEEDGVYIQIALLYTSCSGVRRLRIINQALKTCSQMADLYRSCDLDTIVNFFGKQSVWKLNEHNPKAVKDTMVTRAAQMLANYRKNCANPSSAGQLILPECMKLLPLYVNCLLKSDAISGGADMTLDDRSFVMQAVMTMDVPTSVNYFYPRLLPLHEMKVNDDGQVSIPGPIRCSIAKFSDQGVYILENGIHMFMWIGLAAYQDFVQQVFGVPTAGQVNTETTELPQLDNPYSKAVHSLINNIRRQRHRYMRLTLVRQREKLEPVFRHFLVEDQGHDGSASYVDFLCHMHKEIRAMLS